LTTNDHPLQVVHLKIPSSNQKQNLEGLWPKEKGKITKNGQQNATEKDKD
jgi:hypothetical protein